MGTGATFINGGVLSVVADTNLLGAGTNVNFGGGTLQITGTTVSTARAFQLFQAGTIDVTWQSIDRPGLISGSGSLTKTSAGTLIINGSVPNTFTGGTTIAAAGGVVTISSAGGLGNAGANLTVAGGTLNVNANQSVGNFSGAAAGIVNIGNGATLTVTGSGTGAAQTFAGNIGTGGTGNLVTSGSGTLLLSGTNTFTGGTTVNSGIVAFGATGSVGSTLTVNLGGTAAFNFAFAQTDLAKVTAASAGVVALGANETNSLDFNAAGLTAASLGATGAFTYSGATLTPNGTTYRLGGGGGTLTVSTALTGAGNNLTVGVNGTAPTSTVVLTTGTTNTYGAGTTINSGTLSVGADVNLGASATGITLNGGALLANTTFTTSARAITLAGGAINAASGTTLTLAGALGGGALNVNSNTNGSFQTGTVTLNVANSYSGGTVVNAGTLTLGTAAATVGGGSLTINSSNNATTFNTFSNTGSMGPLSIGNLSGSFLSGTSAITLALFTNTLTITETGSSAYNGIITGTTSGTGANASKLIVTGNGILTLNGLNTYGGSATAFNPSTTVTGGATLSVGRDTSLGTVPSAATASSIVLNGGSLSAFQSFTINSNRGIGLGQSATGTGAGGTIDVANGATLTYGGILANNGTTTSSLSTSNLTKTGLGTLFLTGANTFGGTGATINLNGGTISILLDTALGSTSNTLTFNGGSLLTTATLGLADSKLITLNAGGGTVNANTVTSSGVGVPPVTASELNATTLSGVISGSGPLIINGGGTSGTVILSGTNTNTGGDTISGGVLSIATDSTSGNSALGTQTNALTINGGTLQMTGSAQSDSRAITLGANGGTIAVTGANVYTLSGVVNGGTTGALTKIDTGTLTLSGITNTFQTINLNGGIISIAADAALGTGGNGLNFNGGQLTTTAAFNDARSINLITGGTINLGGAMTLTGTISGAGALTRGAGAFALTLAPTSGANTYTGPTFIGTNSLIVAQDNFLGSTTGVPGALIFNVAGGILNTTGTISTARAFDFLTNSTLTANTGTTLTLTGNVAVSNGVTLTISNTTTGATVFAPAAGNSVFFNPTSTFTIANGAVTLNAGNELPFNGAVTVNGANGSLNLAGFSQIIGSLTSAATAPITTTGTGTTTLTLGQLNAATTTAAGNILGNIGLIKVGTSTQALSGTNTFNGGLTIDGGIVSINALAALGSAAASNTLTLSGGGQLTLTATSPTLTQNVTVNGMGDIDNASGFNITIGSTVGGSGIFSHTSGGFLIFSPTANNFTGGYVVASGGGALQVGNAVGLGAATNTVLATGPFTINPSLNATIGGLAGYGSTITVSTAAFALTDNQGSNTIYTGVLAGAGNYVKAGAGTLTLTGTGTNTGTVTISGGTLNVSTSANFGTGAVTNTLIFNGGTLQINAGGFSSPSTRGVTMTGAGTIDVTGGKFRPPSRGQSPARVP